MERENAAAFSAWNSCLDIIRQSLPQRDFNTWFAPTKGIALSSHTLTVEIPSQTYFQWIDSNYPEILRKALDSVLGSKARLRYSLPKVQNNSSQDDKQDAKIAPKAAKNTFSSQLNPSYTFEQYIEGQANQIAAAAARTIAQNPGKTAFNPMLIYGGVGLGKTHLAQAVGNKVLADNPWAKVLYIPSEKFIQQYVDAHRSNRKNDFINFYQTIDLLIIDDVQFFCGKSGSQEVFFHIFNHLHQNGRQLILTADKAPVEMRDIEDRLLSRFKWGLQTELKSPTFEHRLRILSSKLHRDDISISEDVVRYIAQQVNTNIRELEGVVNSLIAQATFSRKEVDLTLAQHIVSQFVKTSRPEISIDQIKATVCACLGVDVSALESKSRKRDVVNARQIAMYFAKTLTQNHSLQYIGSHIAGRDHSTVLHSCKAVSNLIDTDRQFKSLVDDIKMKIVGA